MPPAPPPRCLGVSPSAPAELWWVLDLLVQTAPYVRPALAELDQSLLPGIERLRGPLAAKARALWEDDLAGCPELLLLSHHAGCLLDDDPSRLFDWLAAADNHDPPGYELLTEPPATRRLVLARFERLCRRGAIRSRYLEMLREIWNVMRERWERDGRSVAEDAARRWLERIAGARIEELVAPRHPLTTMDELDVGDLFAARPSFVVSPLFTCLSGGHVVDLGDYVFVCVAASDLLPIRKTRDAMFVASRLRLLSEPTRVHVLIQVMSAPAGVMEIARALRMSQPTVSGHVKVLVEAGLLHQRRLGSRTVLVASRKRVERLLEDARATLARWD